MHNNKTIIKSVQEYILTCPLFDDGQAAVNYCIDPVDGDVIYRKYADGTILRQFLFALTSMEAYSPDERARIADNGFCQYFQEWLEQQDAEENYPVLEGYIPARLEVLRSGYLFSDVSDTVKYQIQCKLLYSKS